MAFSEVKVLTQVLVLPELGAVDVQWANRVLKDGKLLSEQFERKAYDATSVADFLQEVAGAQHYAAVLGWQV